MNIFVTNKLNGGRIIESDFIPRVGDKIDIFYKPLPIVTDVIAWPSKATQKALGLLNVDIDVIIITD